LKQPFPVPVGLEVLDGLGLDPWEVAGRLPEMVDLLRAMFQECAAVASKLGVEFSVSFNAACRIRRSVGDYRTSTLRISRPEKRSRPTA
jgi:hypothetical protein